MALLGNLLTLVIMGIVLFLYRQSDKRNRALDKVHKYADHLKEDLSSFVADKENAVKDYGIDLDVQQKAAKELMNQLKITKEDLGEKAKAIAKLDDRINAYDTSLEELVRMTAMVQGNLNRIREESAFVETVNKKVIDARERIVVIEKGLAGLKQHFEQENAASLSKVSNMMFAEVKSQVDSLKTDAETVRRTVEEQRNAIEKSEQIRAANLARDMEAVNKTLREVTARAGATADKMEETALAKLKSQAEERIQRLQDLIEENLKKHQEEAKLQIAEINDIASKQRDEWKNDSQALENRQQSLQEKWMRDFDSLTALMQNQQTDWKAKAAAEEAKSKQTLAELETAAANIRAYIVAQNDALEQKLKDTQSHIEENIAALEGRIAAASTSAEQKILENADMRLGNWKQLALDADAGLQKTLRGLETSSGEIKEHFEREIAHLEQSLSETRNRMESDISGLRERVDAASQEAQARVSQEAEANIAQILQSFQSMDKRLSDAQANTDEIAVQLEARFQKTVTDAEERVLESADIHIEDWKRVAIEVDARLRQLLLELETSTSAVKSHFAEETEQIESRMRDIRMHTDQTIADLENSIVKTAAAVDAKIANEANAKLVQWLHESENQDSKAKQVLAELEAVAGDAKAHFASEIVALNKRLKEERDNAETFISELSEKLDSEKIVWDDKLNVAENHTEKAIINLEKQLGVARGDLEKSITALRQTFEKMSTDAESESDERAKVKLAEWNQLFDRESERYKAKIAELETSLIQAKTDMVSELDKADEQNRRLIAGMEAEAIEAKTRLSKEIADAEEEIHSIRGRFSETVDRIETAISTAVTNTDKKVENAANDRLAQWKQAFNEGEEQNKQRIAELENTFAQTQTHISQEIADAEARLQSIRERYEETVKYLENAVSVALAETDAKAENAANDRLIQWKQTFSEGEEQNKQRVAELENTFAQTKTRIEEEIQNAENKLLAVRQEMSDISFSIKNALSESSDVAEARARNIADMADTHAKQTLAETEAAITQIKKHIAEEIESAESRWHELYERINGASASIETVLGKVIADADVQTAEKSAIMEKNIKDFEENAKSLMEKMEDQFRKAAEDMEQTILVETDAKFEEYRKAQTEQFQRFELLSEDADQLENELRRFLLDTEERMKTDFSAFEQTSEQERKTALASFTVLSDALKAQMASIENELASLKERAQENVSRQLKSFEDNFSVDLAKRGEEIDKKLTEWRQFLDNRLYSIAEESESERKTVENVYNENLQAGLAAHQAGFTSEIEKLKADANNFEEGIRDQMKIADESIFSLKEQFRQDMEEARAMAEASVRAEIGKHNLALAETLKQSQRDTEAKIKNIQDGLESRNNEITGLFETSKKDIEEWKQNLHSQIRELDTALEETRKRNRDLIAESNERLSSVRVAIEDVRTEADTHRAELFSRIDEQARELDAAIKETDRHIKEFASQTSLFERADTLKLELSHHIEDLRDEIDRLDQRRVEASDLENQFVKIKRLEDEVNAKMTRFLSEKHRIEQMEIEFNRLLQTSKAVDEKLAQLSASDDTLQAMQVEIRKFNDALESSEERYQRIERKNQTLDAATEGIDRNFKVLQESEQLAARINIDLEKLTAQTASFRSTIDALAGESEKAKDAAQKVMTLDSVLAGIDERIAQAQTSREWLARLETRLEELNAQSQNQIKLMGTLKGAEKDKELPPDTKDNVIKLKRQGWSVEEIARSLKIGRGEVELILEMSRK
jgi:DNA repair exonuclease SbcCD ATPase subunit